MFNYRQKITGQERILETGTYTCSNCGNRLFEASKAFDVGSGFPSFWEHIGDSVTYKHLYTYGRHRIQLLCSQCQQHLGHLFDDARTPSQVRYCIMRSRCVMKNKRIAFLLTFCLHIEYIHSEKRIFAPLYTLI